MSLKEKREQARALAKPGDWGEFIPLENDVETLPPFPLDAFPPGLQDLCAQSAESVGCPVDYPAAHALAVAAGAIGATFDLQVKRGYWANSNLWICVVAPPGSGKSPSAAPILTPLYSEHADRIKNPNADGTKQHVFVSDVTVERLIQMLNESPRGFPMVWDEMAGWLTGFNQYKGGQGSDRSHYLSIWDGRAVKVNRMGSKDKTGGPRENWAKLPRLSIIGGIQPEVLDSLRSGPSDGLFDRLLFCFPNDRGMAVETWIEIDEDKREAWAKALKWIWAIKMSPVLDKRTGDETGERRPNVMRLNDDAREMWKNWTVNVAELGAQKEAPTYFRSVGAKITGYAARLALVIHILREAYGEALPHGVGPEDLKRSISLATYFLDHAGRVYQASGRDDRLLRAKAIINWASTFKEPQWTQNEAWARLRNNTLFRDSAELLDKPLEKLIEHRAIRTVARESVGRGRPPKGGPYELNPILRKDVTPGSNAQ